MQYLKEDYDPEGKTEISYNDLDLDFTVNHGPINQEDGLPEEETSIHIDDYDYEVDNWDVVEALLDMTAADGMLPEEEYSDEEAEAYIEEHFDELVNKYYDKLCEYFRNSAKEKAEKNYEYTEAWTEYDDDFEDYLTDYGSLQDEEDFEDSESLEEAFEEDDLEFDDSDEDDSDIDEDNVNTLAGWVLEDGWLDSDATEEDARDYVEDNYDFFMNQYADRLLNAYEAPRFDSESEGIYEVEPLDDNDEDDGLDPDDDWFEDEDENVLEEDDYDDDIDSVILTEDVNDDGGDVGPGPIDPETAEKWKLIRLPDEEKDINTDPDGVYTYVYAYKPGGITDINDCYRITIKEVEPPQDPPLWNVVVYDTDGRIIKGIGLQRVTTEKLLQNIKEVVKDSFTKMASEVFANEKKSIYMIKISGGAFCSNTAEAAQRLLSSMASDCDCVVRWGEDLNGCPIGYFIGGYKNVADLSKKCTDESFIFKGFNITDPQKIESQGGLYKLDIHPDMRSLAGCYVFTVLTRDGLKNAYKDIDTFVQHADALKCKNKCDASGNDVVLYFYSTNVDNLRKLATECREIAGPSEMGWGLNVQLLPINNAAANILLTLGTWDDLKNRGLSEGLTRKEIRSILKESKETYYVFRLDSALSTVPQKDRSKLVEDQIKFNRLASKYDCSFEWDLTEYNQKIQTFAGYFYGTYDNVMKMYNGLDNLRTNAQWEAEEPIELTPRDRYELVIADAPTGYFFDINTEGGNDHFYDDIDECVKYSNELGCSNRRDGGDPYSLQVYFCSDDPNTLKKLRTKVAEILDKSDVSEYWEKVPEIAEISDELSNKLFLLKAWDDTDDFA